MKGSHVVQPVGQLNQQHPDVFGHGEDEFTEVLRLLGLIGLELDPRQLGHPVDQARHFLAKGFPDFLQRRVRVLDGVMQEGGDDGRRIDLVIGQDAGDFQGVGKIGIARGPGLRAVRLHGKHVGAVEHLFVGRRIIPLDPLD